MLFKLRVSFPNYIMCIPYYTYTHYKCIKSNYVYSNISILIYNNINIIVYNNIKNRNVFWEATPMACGILVPVPGFELVASAGRVES